MTLPKSLRLSGPELLICQVFSQRSSGESSGLTEFYNSPDPSGQSWGPRDTRELGRRGTCSVALGRVGETQLDLGESRAAGWKAAFWLPCFRSAFRGPDSFVGQSFALICAPLRKLHAQVTFTCTPRFLEDRNLVITRVPQRKDAPLPTPIPELSPTFWFMTSSF